MELSQKGKVIIFLGVLFLILPGVLSAAEVSFTPLSGSYSVGQTFAVSVFVSSTDQAMNAASGIVSFPNNLLQVVSLSKTGSIFNLWVQEPSFSNNSGTLRFEGVVLNPGFKGLSGKLITINFRVVASGSATVSLAQGSVLANDGNGTEILQNSGKAYFSLAGALIPDASETPLGSEITSPTHPDQSKWYSNNDPLFRWNIGADTTAARLQYDKSPSAEPNIEYTPAVSEKQLEDIGDGSYYFHVQLRNSAGWGTVEHFKFNIDTTKPISFTIEEIERSDKTDPRARFRFSAQDLTSGVSHYEVRIDNGDWQTWRDDGTHVFQLDPIFPGEHKLSARAVDRAGNFLTGSADFFIQGLETPTIEDYPKQVASGEPIIVSGKAISDVKVILYLQRGTDQTLQYTGQSNSSGSFTVHITEKIKDGAYKAWVQAVDDRGAMSNFSDKVTILVNQPAFITIGSFVINVLAVLISILALLFCLLFIAWWSWYKLMIMRSRMKKEVHKTNSHIHKAFDVLREEVISQIKLLDKVRVNRPLNMIEQKIMNNLKKKLEKAEIYIEKEVENMEKDVFK